MAKPRFYHYNSRTQLETDITAGKVNQYDLVFVDDVDDGTLIWTHSKYYTLSEVEFKNFLDLYTSSDIIVGSYVIASADSSIDDTDSINDALGKLEYKIQQLEQSQEGESTDTYKLCLNDEGGLYCVKGESGEGFQLSADGGLSLKN